MVHFSCACHIFEAAVHIDFIVINLEIRDEIAVTLSDLFCFMYGHIVRIGVFLGNCLFVQNRLRLLA